MNIAIIGGGAAGMITAYLLDQKGHAVEVFEKTDKLGGNIRTLNKNVSIASKYEHLYLEGGVIKDIEQINFDRIISFKIEAFNNVRDNYK